MWSSVLTVKKRAIARGFPVLPSTPAGRGTCLPADDNREAGLHQRAHAPRACGRAAPVQAASHRRARPARDGGPWGGIVWNKTVAYLYGPWCHIELQFTDGAALSVYSGGKVRLRQRQFDVTQYTCMSIACTTIMRCWHGPRRRTTSTAGSSLASRRRWRRWLRCGTTAWARCSRHSSARDRAPDELCPHGPCRRNCRLRRCYRLLGRNGVWKLIPSDEACLKLRIERQDTDWRCTVKINFKLPDEDSTERNLYSIQTNRWGQS